VKPPAIFILSVLVWATIGGPAPAQDRQSNFATADTRELNYKQFGLLAIQDGGRR
jgi:hypothetical protein